MISIKKYLDQTFNHGTNDPSADAAESIAAALHAFCSTILAMGEHAVRAFPATGAELLASFEKIERELSRNRIAPRESAAKVEQQLQLWSDNTVHHLKQKAGEARELLLVLAKAGEEAYERDRRYTGQFEEITKQLSSIAHLDDLSQVRAVVMKSTAALKSSTEKMALDGAESLMLLRAQVSDYQTRLEEAERIASRDCLTALRSRFDIQGQIQRRLEEKRAFSLIMLDLNGFKQVNDSYGHAAGDELLKKFSTELSSTCRAGDVIGRWGGDEFLLVVDGPHSNAVSRAQRIKEWVCGEYTLELDGGTTKVELGASMGVVESKANDTIAEIVKRADAAMYKEKNAAKSAGKKGWLSRA